MIRQKLCGNCAFPQNFHTTKLGEITVFYAVFGRIAKILKRITKGSLQYCKMSLNDIIFKLAGLKVYELMKPFTDIVSLIGHVLEKGFSKIEYTFFSL